METFLATLQSLGLCRVIAGPCWAPRWAVQGKKLTWLSRLQTVVLILLIFTLGVEIGADEQVVASQAPSACLPWSIPCSSWRARCWVLLVRKCMGLDRQGPQEPPPAERRGGPMTGWIVGAVAAACWRDTLCSRRNGPPTAAPLSPWGCASSSSWLAWTLGPPAMAGHPAGWSQGAGHPGGGRRWNPGRRGRGWALPCPHERQGRHGGLRRLWLVFPGPSSGGLLPSVSAGPSCPMLCGRSLPSSSSPSWPGGWAIWSAWGWRAPPPWIPSCRWW